MVRSAARPSTPSNGDALELTRRPNQGLGRLQHAELVGRERGDSQDGKHPGLSVGRNVGHGRLRDVYANVHAGSAKQGEDCHRTPCACCSVISAGGMASSGR